MPLTSDFDKYLLSVNEPIDKLTVNRPFNRIYDDISKIDSVNYQLTVSKATSAKYGLVKFSSASDYYRELPENASKAITADYYDHVMGVSQIRYFVDNIEHSSDIKSYFTSSDKPYTELSAWIDLKIGDISFINMPNGNTMLIGDFDIALNNIPLVFNTTSVVSSDIEYPVSVGKFGTTIDADGDLLIINDYNEEINELIGKSSGIIELSSFVGQKIECDYISPLSATLRHNKCDWTDKSSFKQSYVEVVYSMSIDVSSLSKKYYDYSMFNVYNGGKKTTTAIEGDIGKDFKPFVFSQKPIIIPQLAFYNNESRIKPYAKFCTAENEDGIEEDYFDDAYFAESPLTETEVDENIISSVNGNVTLKKYDNIYAKNGTISNNKLLLDVSMKFFVGSAADPLLIDGMTDLNSKAKLQVLMIGI